MNIESFCLIPHSSRLDPNLKEVHQSKISVQVGSAIESIHFTSVLSLAHPFCKFILDCYLENISRGKNAGIFLMMSESEDSIIIITDLITYLLEAFYKLFSNSEAASINSFLVDSSAIFDLLGNRNVVYPSQLKRHVLESKDFREHLEFVVDIFSKFHRESHSSSNSSCFVNFHLKNQTEFFICSSKGNPILLTTVMELLDKSNGWMNLNSNQSMLSSFLPHFFTSLSHLVLVYLYSNERISQVFAYLRKFSRLLNEYVSSPHSELSRKPVTNSRDIDDPSIHNISMPNIVNQFAQISSADSSDRSKLPCTESTLIDGGTYCSLKASKISEPQDINLSLTEKEFPKQEREDSSDSSPLLIELDRKENNKFDSQFHSLQRQNKNMTKLLHEMLHHASYKNHFISVAKNEIHNLSMGNQKLINENELLKIQLESQKRMKRDMPMEFGSNFKKEEMPIDESYSSRTSKDVRKTSNKPQKLNTQTFDSISDACCLRDIPSLFEPYNPFPFPTSNESHTFTENSKQWTEELLKNRRCNICGSHGISNAFSSRHQYDSTGNEYFPWFENSSNSHSLSYFVNCFFEAIKNIELDLHHLASSTLPHPSYLAAGIEDERIKNYCCAVRRLSNALIQIINRRNPYLPNARFGNFPNTRPISDFLSFEIERLSYLQRLLLVYHQLESDVHRLKESFI